MKHLIDFLKWVIYHSLGSQFNEKPSAIFMVIVLVLSGLVFVGFLIALLLHIESYYVLLLIPIGIVAWAVYDYRKSK